MFLEMVHEMVHKMVPYAGIFQDWLAVHYSVPVSASWFFFEDSESNFLKLDPVPLLP
jgi:hypothetical protein